MCHGWNVHIKLSEILFDGIDFLYNVYLILPLLYKHLCENFLDNCVHFSVHLLGHINRFDKKCLLYVQSYRGVWYMNICRCDYLFCYLMRDK